jgi:hypothetical protein
LLVIFGGVNGPFAAPKVGTDGTGRDRDRDRRGEQDRHHSAKRRREYAHAPHPS